MMVDGDLGHLPEKELNDLSVPFESSDIQRRSILLYVIITSNECHADV